MFSCLCAGGGAIKLAHAYSDFVYGFSSLHRCFGCVDLRAPCWRLHIWRVGDCTYGGGDRAIREPGCSSCALCEILVGASSCCLSQRECISQSTLGELYALFGWCLFDCAGLEFARGIASASASAPAVISLACIRRGVCFVLGLIRYFIVKGWHCFWVASLHVA